MIKSILLQVSILIGILPLLPAQNFETDISSNFEHIGIFQNGIKIESSNDTFFIDKDKFEIVFSYKSPINFLVNGSVTPESYDIFYTENNLDKIPGFSGTGMAEGLRNDSLNITLSKDSPNAWFYEDETKNRFDKNDENIIRIRSTRTIENITFQGEEAIPVGKSDISVLYLCIVEYEYKNYKRNILSKKRIKIVFE